MRGERQVPAVRVRRGDQVRVWGEWQEVMGNRLERYATGGMAVVLDFLTAYPLRIPAASMVLVAAPADPGPLSAPADLGPLAGQKPRLCMADWAVRADASGSPVVAAECASCGEFCEPSPSMSAQPVWCVDHAERTGHTGFRRIVTDFVRVSGGHGEGVACDEGV
ncbi:hypothetical protein OHA98_04860 [Streptomyces sp. NBC_00654]|uniref:DUF7848 domain-containing protein n=1 Tax=Streptomyces sp. NBC_00654 TaxID=2975799 RepID=UPI00225358CC|nr:hypothetical protein [Streptomyces sp. NBC_00654]MCX4964155.1 hypothetical protein [Streptomyces sp. NBC_00654]